MLTLDRPVLFPEGEETVIVGISGLKDMNPKPLSVARKPQPDLTNEEKLAVLLREARKLRRRADRLMDQAEVLKRAIGLRSAKLFTSDAFGD